MRHMAAINLLPFLSSLLMRKLPTWVKILTTPLNSQQLMHMREIYLQTEYRTIYIKYHYGKWVYERGKP